MSWCQQGQEPTDSRKVLHLEGGDVASREIGEEGRSGRGNRCTMPPGRNEQQRWDGGKRWWLEQGT